MVNVSEGRTDAVLDELAAACGDVLADRHRDAGHHRAVLTLAGPSAEVEEASRHLAATAVARLDLSGHDGSHPRFGVVDVVPFVPLELPRTGDRFGPPASLEVAVAARDGFARWAGGNLDLPCFLYGPLADGSTRALPDVRRTAFAGLTPDAGPAVPHPTAGACAVGARGFLVAYNLWLAAVPGTGLALARSVAAALRGPAVRALGLDVGGQVQISCNLVDPFAVGPAAVYDRAASLLQPAGGGIERCELVGLVPEAVLAAIPAARWAELDLSPETTIEARFSWR